MIRRVYRAKNQGCRQSSLSFGCMLKSLALRNFDESSEYKLRTPSSAFQARRVQASVSKDLGSMVYPGGSYFIELPLQRCSLHH